jgi:hypothetical protein
MNKVGLLTLSLALPALAAVDGTVINKTTGKPQPGATVTLYKLGAQTGLESIESVKSGAQGQFVINQPTEGGPHLLQSAYDGVTYNHMLPPGTPSSGLTLEVYNSSKQPGVSRLERHFLIFQPSGAEMTVNEGFVFENAGPTTWNDPDAGTLKFYLPAGAEGKVQVRCTAPQGMPIERVPNKTTEKDIYKVDFPIKPGETNFQVTYVMPYTDGAVYDGKVLFQTAEPTLVAAPPGVTLKGDGLESKGQEPRTQTAVYAVKGSEYKVEIAGSVAPAAGGDSDSGDSGPAIQEVMPRIWGRMPWILALALGILALGFIVLYRAQPAAAAAAPAAKAKPERTRR